MLRQSIERCPDDVWAAGAHPRTFWRVTYHTLYYTHLYLMPKLEDFKEWDQHQNQAKILWDDDEDGIPPMEVTYTQADMLEYLDQIDGNLAAWLDAIDFDSPESGFYWYKIPKLDHQILNVRHLGVHVGQLQELLYAQDIDLDWVSRK